MYVLCVYLFFIKRKLRKNEKHEFQVSFFLSEYAVNVRLNSVNTCASGRVYMRALTRMC